MKGRESVRRWNGKKMRRVSYTFSQVIIQGGIPKIPYLKPEQGVA
jgi:hypothetical protein